MKHWHTTLGVMALGALLAAGCSSSSNPEGPGPSDAAGSPDGDLCASKVRPD
jgi:hypothetical protein